MTPFPKIYSATNSNFSVADFNYKRIRHKRKRVVNTKLAWLCRSMAILSFEHMFKIILECSDWVDEPRCSHKDSYMDHHLLLP